MKQALRILVVILWLWIGIIGNLPPCWLIFSIGFEHYTWPTASLHGPYCNHHSGFPFLYIDKADLDAWGGITLHFVYWKLIFDLAFLATSTYFLCIMTEHRRQFSIGMLLAQTGFVAVVIATSQYLNHQNDPFAARALIATALYSVPILYCMSLLRRQSMYALFVPQSKSASEPWREPKPSM